MSPRPPPTISHKDDWMKELDSEVAGSIKDTQRIQSKPKTQLSRTERPLCGLDSTQSCVSMLIKTEEEDQTILERPVLVEEHDIDFRMPGLSHAVVKEAKHLRVQELVKKIESHLHREALQADLQQNNVYNPFSNNSKARIRELGNAEFFELCETFPKYNVRTVFSIGIKELCTALADTSWLTANPEESFINQDWMHSLSRTS